MNDVKKNIIKCVAVLSIIAMISGALLGLVNQITYVSPEEMVNRELNKFFVADSFEKVAQEGSSALYEAKAGSEVFYIASASGEGGYSGNVPIFTKIVDGVVLEVKAGTNQETIKAPFGDGYISNFISANTAEVESFSFDGANGSVQVDGITGATKSSRAIMDGVNKCMAIYRSAEVD